MGGSTLEFWKKEGHKLFHNKVEITGSLKSTNCCSNENGKDTKSVSWLSYNNLGY